MEVERPPDYVVDSAQTPGKNEALREWRYTGKGWGQGESKGELIGRPASFAWDECMRTGIRPAHWLRAAGVLHRSCRREAGGCKSSAASVSVWVRPAAQ